MDSDIPRQLKQAAHTPTDELDMGAVERRTRRLRRRRVLEAATPALAVLLIVPSVFLGVQYWNGSGGPRDVEPVSPPTQQKPPHSTGSLVPENPTREPNALSPSIRTDGGRTVMPVTLPDGTTAELVYPDSLDLKELKVTPYGSAQLGDCCARDFFFPPGGEAWFAQAGKPIKQFRGADGQTVSLYPGRSGEATRYLVFEFGSWTLGVWDGQSGAHMTDQQLALWAKHLHGRETPNGYLTLSTTGPLRLSQGGATALEFGTKTGRSMRIVRGPGCTDTQTQTRRPFPGDDNLVSLCHPDWRMNISAYGNEQFVDSVINDMQIRDVRIRR